MSEWASPPPSSLSLLLLCPQAAVPHSGKGAQGAAWVAAEQAVLKPRH